jgi:uncharacterized protein (PEP-CTERM system associated)
VQTQMNVALEYAFKRTTATLRYFEFDRLFQSGGNSESLRGASLNLSRSLRRRLKLDLGATWRTNTSSIDESKGTFFSIYPSLNYELGPHTTARFQYEYSRNSGGSSSSFGSPGGGGGFAGGGFGLGNTNIDSGYVENAVTASLIVHL